MRRRQRIILVVVAMVSIWSTGIAVALACDWPAPSNPDSEAAPEPSESASPAPSGSAAALDGTLYADGGQAGDWAAAHQGDRRAAVIARMIAAVPQGVWITGGGAATQATNQVRETVTAAKQAGQIPVFVAYAIPGRDCGGASAGGAADATAYRGWIDGFADGLGTEPSIVILEPDALAQTDCLEDSQRGVRNELIAYAARTLAVKAPQAQVYYDAGNSGWQSPEEMAARLKAAGADQYGAGIALNVSNFKPTADEVAYGKAILAALGGAGKKIVVDTSRNGAGEAADGQWCDPAGRRLGQQPTLETGDQAVAAFLWVKRPGEADGCAATAGQFVPDLAASLAEGAQAPTPDNGYQQR